MERTIVEMLHLETEPVGIFLGNSTASCDFQAPKQQRNCVMPLLMAAAAGRVVSIDTESCNCPGGAVGCCFGDGFTRLNPNIHKLLSQGYGEQAPPQMPEHLKTGERFFCSEEAALKWRNALPYSDKGYPRVVFAPKSRWDEIGAPDLVYVFADPDQISVLITMLGFHNGEALNAIAPFGAACHSIVFAAEQMEKARPWRFWGCLTFLSAEMRWQTSFR